MSDYAARIHRDTLMVLRGLSKWELSPARWDGVVAILDAMTTSLELDDLDALAKATIDLEQIGPVRFKRIGAASEDPPPPAVRERTNELIYRLSGKAGEDV